MKKYLGMLLTIKKQMWSTKFWVGFWTFGYAGLAFAAEAMPWDGPLCGLANGLRGPAALAISTIAFFAAGASFLWGEEIAGISKKLVTIVMAVTILLGGASLVGWIGAKMGAFAGACG